MENMNLVTRIKDVIKETYQKGRDLVKEADQKGKEHASIVEQNLAHSVSPEGVSPQYTNALEFAYFVGALKYLFGKR